MLVNTSLCHRLNVRISIQTTLTFVFPKIYSKKFFLFIIFSSQTGSDVSTTLTSLMFLFIPIFFHIVLDDNIFLFPWLHVKSLNALLTKQHPRKVLLWEGLLELQIFIFQRRLYREWVMFEGGGRECVCKGKPNLWSSRKFDSWTEHKQMPWLHIYIQGWKGSDIFTKQTGS